MVNNLVPAVTHTQKSDCFDDIRLVQMLVKTPPPVNLQMSPDLEDKLGLCVLRKRLLQDAAAAKIDCGNPQMP